MYTGTYALIHMYNKELVHTVWKLRSPIVCSHQAGDPGEPMV